MAVVTCWSDREHSISHSPTADLVHRVLLVWLITHAGGSRCAGAVISGICDFVFVCVSVRALKEKNDKLSTHKFGTRT